MSNLYDMIFKRKSIRSFNKDLHLSKEDLADIKKRTDTLKKLCPDIKTEYEIVPVKDTTCKRGEYCILIYSEEKDNYLENIGYMFEELDLYLASKNIGVCWYGFGKPKTVYYPDLKFVIMMAIGKADESQFRADYKKAKRKNICDMWEGRLMDEVGEIARYAPSACNSQPWFVKADGSLINIYRTKKIKSILLRLIKEKGRFYNKIDLGIFLCILEIVLEKEGYIFERTLLPEEEDSDLISVASYKYQRP